MADKMDEKHDGATLSQPAPDKMKLSASDSQINNVELKECEPKTKDSDGTGRSRFRVAKVEFVNEDPKTSAEEPAEAAGGDGESDRRSRNASGRASDAPSPPLSPHQTDSYSTYNTHSYDTHNLKTFGRNTLETLPHLDHYRNILTATSAIKKRPTLLELHDHDKVSVPTIGHSVAIKDKTVY